MDVLEFLSSMDPQRTWSGDRYSFVDVRNHIHKLDEGLLIRDNGLVIVPYANQDSSFRFPYDFYAQIAYDQEDKTSFPSESRVSPAFNELENVCCCVLDPIDPVIKKQTLIEYLEKIQGLGRLNRSENEASAISRAFFGFIAF